MYEVTQKNTHQIINKNKLGYYLSRASKDGLINYVPKYICFLYILKN